MLRQMYKYMVTVADFDHFV